MMHDFLRSFLAAMMLAGLAAMLFYPPASSWTFRGDDMPFLGGLAAMTFPLLVMMAILASAGDD